MTYFIGRLTVLHVEFKACALHSKLLNVEKRYFELYVTNFINFINQLFYPNGGKQCETFSGIMLLMLYEMCGCIS